MAQHRPHRSKAQGHSVAQTPPEALPWTVSTSWSGFKDPLSEHSCFPLTAVPALLLHSL